MIKIIFYQDHYCALREARCDRGSMKECPAQRNGLEVPCKHFTHKDDIKEERGA